MTGVLAACTPSAPTGPAVATATAEYPRGCSEAEVRELVGTFVTAFNEANQIQLDRVLSAALDVYAVSVGNEYVVIRGKESALQELARSRSAGELMQLRDLRVIPMGTHNMFVGLEFRLDKRIGGRALAFSGKGTVDCDAQPPRILAWGMAAPAR